MAKLVGDGPEMRPQAIRQNCSSQVAIGAKHSEFSDRANASISDCEEATLMNATSRGIAVRAEEVWCKK